MYRYDGRGALADLLAHEPPTGGFDQRTILTEEELKVEQLCDMERYQSLYKNDVEESMYHGNMSFFFREYFSIIFFWTLRKFNHELTLQKRR